MSMQRRAVLVMLLLLVAVAVSGLWLWARLVRTAVSRLQAGTATVAPAATIAAAAAGGETPTPVQPPPGYRLAGVAVGEPESFAVVEPPNGSTGLYRVHDEIPGLGELVRIDAERIVVRGDSGQLELWLMPAATATPTAVRTLKSRTPTVKPQPRPPAGGTAPGPGS